MEPFAPRPRLRLRRQPIARLDTATALLAGLCLEVESRMLLVGELLDTVIGIPDAWTEIVILPPSRRTRAESQLRQTSGPQREPRAQPRRCQRLPDP